MTSHTIIDKTAYDHLPAPGRTILSTTYLRAGSIKSSNGVKGMNNKKRSHVYNLNKCFMNKMKSLKHGFRLKGYTSKFRSALLLSAIAFQPASSWALGSNVSAFTYNGSQQGLTTGTVYTLSTYNDFLGFCQLSPSTTQSTGYSSTCQTGMGTQNNNMYSAVSYLGTANNPNNTFIVGDNSGKIYPTNLNFYSNLNPPVYNVTSVTVGAAQQVCTLYGTGVSNLVVDPNGQYLYVGCAQNIPFNLEAYNEGKENTWIRTPTNNGNYNLPGFQLWSIPITPNGTLGIPVVQTQFNNNFSTWQFIGPTQTVPVTSGFWHGANPVMRAYPANSPVLGSSAFTASGAVLVSGLVGSLDNDMPVNNGLICSNGECQIAYNLAFNYGNNDFGVITAAEAGIDYFSGSYSPSLYFNVVNQAGWNGGLLPPFTAEVGWSKSDNSLFSCDTNIFNISADNTNNATTYCSGNGPTKLEWAAQGMPEASKGQQVDITNLMFIPAPTGMNTDYPQGLLTIGTWSSGYVALHAPSTQNTSTSMILGGSVGNVNSFLSDVNGNAMFATSTAGLFAYNAFPASQNDATLSSITLIPNSADNGLTGNESVLSKSIFVLNKTSSIAGLVLAASTPRSEPIHGSVINKILISDAVATLEKVLGYDPYRGQFLYTESQLQAMGVNKGAVIRGISFRSAQGIQPDAENYQYFKKFKIDLSKAKTKQNNLSEAFSKNIDPSSRKVTANSKLFVNENSLVANKSYPGNSDTSDFAPPILFGAPYKYNGGNLLIDIQHSNLSINTNILIDAIATPNQQGVYKSLTKGAKTHGMRAIPAVQFIQ